MNVLREIVVFSEIFTSRGKDYKNFQWLVEILRQIKWKFCMQRHFSWNHRARFMVFYLPYYHNFNSLEMAIITRESLTYARMADFFTLLCKYPNTFNGALTWSEKKIENIGC